MSPTPDPPIHEGFIPFPIPGEPQPAQTWYKVIGDISASPIPPLITLHGGPGAGHNYLLALTDLYTRHKIPIIFYDQVGCGKSTHFREKAGDEAFWTIELFIRQLDNLINFFKLRENEKGFWLLGSSWGGLLGGAYASTSPSPFGLKKVVIVSGPADMRLYVEGARKLLKELPEHARKTIEECESRGDYESETFESAMEVFAKKHVCHLEEWPVEVGESFGVLGDDMQSYKTMLGPSDFYCTGSLKDWEGGSEAHNIKVPVLLARGRYDEVQEECMKPWAENIPQVRWEVFEESSHMPFWEERERFMDVVGEFLMG